MSYVIEYTRQHYYRLECIRKGVLVFMLVLCLALGLLGLFVKDSYDRETLRDFLKGDYNVDVNKLKDLQVEWADVENLHTNLVPYLQLAWAPQPITNILHDLVGKIDTGGIPGYLTPKTWWVAFDGKNYTSNQVSYAANISAKLTFESEWFNKNRTDETRMCLSNLFENPVKVCLFGLGDEKKQGTVTSSYKLRSFKNLLVSSVLPATLLKTQAFREEIRNYNFSKTKKEDATLDSAVLSYREGRKKFSREYDRCFDPEEIIKKYPPTRINDPEVQSVLKKWAEIADGRFPWSRMKSKSIRKSENFVKLEDVKTLLEKFPKPVTLDLVERKLRGQCGSLTNSFLVTQFYGLASDNIYTTELAPKNIAIPGAVDPIFEVKVPSDKSPSWFWIEFLDGSSNRMSFASWTYALSAKSDNGMTLSNLLSAALAISQSGRGYELGSFEFQFMDDGKHVDKAEFTGLVPLIYPVTGSACK